MAYMNDPLDPEQMRRKALMDALGDGPEQPPAPNDPLNPAFKQNAQAEFERGTSAGRDMSWMRQPGQPLEQPRNTTMPVGGLDKRDNPIASPLPQVDQQLSGGPQLGGPQTQPGGGLGSLLSDTPAQRPTGNNPQSTETFRYGQGGGPSLANLPTTGFDIARDQNPNKSAKDAFLFEAMQPDAAGSFGRAAMDKSDDGALEQWFRQYVMPDMQARGYEVLDVVGDKAYVKSWDGEGWTDFTKNAGAANAELAWQPEGGGGGAMTGGGDPLAALLGGGGGQELAGDDILAQILKQIQGLSEGQNPMGRDAIMELLTQETL